MNAASFSTSRMNSALDLMSRTLLVVAVRYGVIMVVVVVVRCISGGGELLH